MTIELLFVGLQEIGASMAQAVAEAGVDAYRVGYDRDRAARGAAQKAGAVDKLVLNPYKGAASADVLLVTLPAGEADRYVRDVADHLKPGAAILDCSPLQASTFRWTAEHLGPDRHYLGAIPVIGADWLFQLQSDYRDARADLFQDSSLALVVPADLPEKVLNIAVNLAEAIGSAPFFLDAGEMEAVTSLTSTLPATLGLSLLGTAAHSRGWPDIQRLAGRQFAASTNSSLELDAEQMAESLLQNSNSLTVHLDDVIERLARLRQLIADDERDELEDLIETAQSAHTNWLRRRQRADWEANAMSSAETASTGMLGNLFGFRPPRPRDDN